MLYLWNSCKKYNIHAQWDPLYLKHIHIFSNKNKNMRPASIDR